MSEELQRQQVEIRATWVGLEELTIQFVNQALAQVDDQGEVVIAFGQASPPVILGGTPDEQRKYLESVPFVQIRPIVRMSMSARRIEEVIGMLQKALDQQKLAKQPLEGGES